MEITRIDEATHATISQDIKTHKFVGKSCIYYSDRVCRAPRLQYKICRTCPRCTQFVRKNVERSLFGHIKAFAISLMQNMGVGAGQGSGAGGGSGGAEGGSGGGAGGGGGGA